jgi:hypothetical protein
MMDFKGCKEFFNFLKMPNNPQKHWIDTTSWSMAKAMQDFVFQSTHLAMQKAQFISVSHDEMTIINN